MLRRCSMAAVLLIVLSSAVSLVHAGTIGLPAGPDPFRFFFDENGHGAYQTFNPTTGAYGPLINSPGVLVVDPLTATGFALQYTLPEFVGAGDAGILESGTTCTAATCSDGLRFITGAATSFMRYYSDVGEPDLADTGLPSNFTPGAFAIELGTEGSTRTFQYVAGSGDPAATNFYLGISDTPEPSTIVLLATGLFGVGGIAYRRKKQAVR